VLQLSFELDRLSAGVRFVCYFYAALSGNVYLQKTVNVVEFFIFKNVNHTIVHIDSFSHILPAPIFILTIDLGQARRIIKGIL